MRSTTSKLPVLFLAAVMAVAFSSTPSFALSIEKLGPFAQRQDSYQIGREHLRLKALLVGSRDEKDIQYAADQYRKDRGTNSYEWKIGYTELTPGAEQSLVLSWYNLDTSEDGWLAVRIEKDGKWVQMSNRTGKWNAFQNKNLIYRETTNGHLVVLRVSRVTPKRAAYAFSETAILLDMN
jgi:hypothetical protein